MKLTSILNELLSILNVIQERIYVFLIVNLFLARNKVESNIFFGFSGKQKCLNTETKTTTFLQT